VRAIAEIQAEVEYRELQATRYSDAAHKELDGDAPFKLAAAKAWAEQAAIEIAKARALLWALGSDER
jgi:hypothetical protein